MNDTVPCRICNNPTSMLGTKLCDRCWELEGRINRDPDLALRILGIDDKLAALEKWLRAQDYVITIDYMGEAPDSQIRLQTGSEGKEDSYYGQTIAEAIQALLDKNKPTLNS